MSYNNHDPKDPQRAKFQRLAEAVDESELSGKDYSQEGMLINIFANAKQTSLREFIKFMKSKYKIEKLTHPSK